MGTPSELLSILNEQLGMTVSCVGGFPYIRAEVRAANARQVASTMAKTSSIFNGLPTSKQILCQHILFWFPPFKENEMSTHPGIPNQFPATFLTSFILTTLSDVSGPGSDVSSSTSGQALRSGGKLSSISLIVTPL